MIRGLCVLSLSIPGLVLHKPLTVCAAGGSGDVLTNVRFRLQPSLCSLFQGLAWHICPLHVVRIFLSRVWAGGFSSLDKEIWWCCFFVGILKCLVFFGFGFQFIHGEGEQRPTWSGLATMPRVRRRNRIEPPRSHTGCVYYREKERLRTGWCDQLWPECHMQALN